MPSNGGERTVRYLIGRGFEPELVQEVVGGDFVQPPWNGPFGHGRGPPAPVAASPLRPMVTADQFTN